MKKLVETICICSLLLTGILGMGSCTDSLDVQQMYEFDLVTLPVQTTIKEGEEAEIRCQLVRNGRYENTTYSIRWFQPSGKGELRLEDGTVLQPNDLYPLPGETFRLYYKSLCTDQQKIDIYIVDSFQQLVQRSFSFNNEEAKKEEDDV